MKKILRKNNLVVGILVLIVVCLGIVFASDVIVKEGAIKAWKVTAGEFMVMDTNLLGYWKFNGNYNDSSLYDNHGTPYGDPSVEGHFLELDGVGDFVNCPDISFEADKDYTYSVWVKVDYDIQEDCAILSDQYMGGGEYNGWALRWENYLDKVEFQNDGWQGPGTFLQRGEWYHIAVTYQYAGGGNAYVDIHLNGDLVDGGTYPFSSSTGNFKIGWWMYEYIYYFIGKIDNVKIFNRVLEEEEILRLYERDNEEHVYFPKLYADSLDVSGDISCDWDITALGKITGNPVDPSFVLYDSETRQGIIELAKATIPPNKQDGAALFFNKERKRLEIYVQSEGKFYDLQGNLIFSLPEPVVATTFKTRRYHLDTRTGEVRELQRVDAKKWRLKEGYKFDTKTGKFYKYTIDLVNQVVTKEEVTKDEAIVFE